MRTAELEKTILLMFRGNELYGYEINKLLSLQDISINISRLYSVLNDMQTDGLLLVRWEKSSTGPRKKMYRLSKKGKDALNEILLESISMVHRFYGDYLRELYPRVNVFGEIMELVTDGLESSDVVAYLTHFFSGIHEMLVSRIFEKITDGKMYLVTPEPSEKHIDIENLNVLDGSYESLPFKKNYINRFIVIGVPNQSLLDDSIQEWRRVIADGGSLIIITPTILIQEEEEPLSIGDFVERYEHQVIEKGEPIDPGMFFSILKANFNDINEVEKVHMSFITAKN